MAAFRGRSYPMLFLCIFASLTALTWGKGMLFPRDSESRQIRNLDGMWNFRIDTSSNRNASFEQNWFARELYKSGPVIPMPVPSSYNDIYDDKTIRNFVGWAWYDRQFYVPADWKNKRIVLRFDSAHYYSIVYVNGKEVMQHNGGHLPFETDINSYVNIDGPNTVTLALNNTLMEHTLPPGSLTFQHDTNRYPSGYFVQNVQMDFFNYAGIHRHVRIYSTPKTYIDDITITTDINQAVGIVNYKIVAGGNQALVKVTVEILDRDGNVVGSQTGLTGSISIDNAHFWWPYTMNVTDTAYLYTMKVTLGSPSADTDVYRLPFGIRTVKMTTNQWLINNKPFYCHGVNKHEDADIRGKGLDYALIARDFAMLKWLGANCFRTSHYPYAEEILDEADRQGIVIIDESPGVGITQPANFMNESIAHHKEVMEELVRRDKNRPAVMVWSVANEPKSAYSGAGPYFKAVIGHTRSLDPTRPVTFVCSNHDYNNDHAMPYVDIILLNRYFGWYSDNGHTEVIQLQIDFELKNWRQKYNKPIMFSEYGADTIAGLHREPSFVFSEEYQVDFMSEYHKAFDKHRNDYFVGELVWNFADFMTVQGITRVNGNRKGVLTRQREPKASAHLLRKRYYSIFNATSTFNNYC